MRTVAVWRAAIACLVGLGGLVGCGAPEAPPPLPPPRVTVAFPESRELTDYDDYTGFLEAAEQVEVRARVRGHVDKVHFQDGQPVKKDDLLFELDPRPFQSEIDRAKETLKIGQAQHVAAVKEEARLKELLGKGGASKSQVEKAEADTLSLAAQIAAYEEELKRRELELTYSRIVAPIAGKIGRAELTAGNLVNAGGSDPLLTTIVSIDPIHLYFRVDERALQRYMAIVAEKRKKSPDAPPQSLAYPFLFALDSDDGYPNRAVLTFAQNRIDRATGTIEVRGDVANPDGKFIPGSRVRIRLPIGDSYQAVVVPERAVLSDQDRKYLLVVNSDDVVVRRDVELGRLLDDGGRVVLKHLRVDEPIVVNGLQRARINDPIEPLDAQGKPFQRSAASKPADEARSAEPPADGKPAERSAGGS